MNSLQPKILCVFLPYELIVEVLSFLLVKSLKRLRCVCKSWKILISDSSFIKLHLKRSTTNKHLALFSSKYQNSNNFSVARFPVQRLLENTPITIIKDHYFRLKDNFHLLIVVCSYNGLLCLVDYDYYSINNEQIFLYLLNPATRTFTDKILFPCNFMVPSVNRRQKLKFAFGYDNSSDTYKIVAFSLLSCEVRILNLGQNVWRNIQTFQMPPIDYSDRSFSCPMGMNDGVNVNGSVNWLTIQTQSQNEYEDDWRFISVDRFVLISIDFSTETYCQLSPPQIFYKVSPVRTSLAVLMDSLCFSHDFNRTDFIIWQMKEFSVQDSWTQFIKISYQSLPNGNPISNWLVLFPLCLYENDNTLILASCDTDGKVQAILYNLSGSRGEKARISNEIEWFIAKDYVESLVSTSWN